MRRVRATDRGEPANRAEPGSVPQFVRTLLMPRRHPLPALSFTPAIGSIVTDLDTMSQIR